MKFVVILPLGSGYPSFSKPFRKPVNTLILERYSFSFDPYLYILLNLFLSMLAAVQAPVILMSQNRQGVKDRLDAAHD